MYRPVNRQRSYRSKSEFITSEVKYWFTIHDFRHCLCLKKSGMWISVYAEVRKSAGMSGCVWMLEDVYTCGIYTLCLQSYILLN